MLSLASRRGGPALAKFLPRGMMGRRESPSWPTRRMRLRGGSPDGESDVGRMRAARLRASMAPPGSGGRRSLWDGGGPGRAPRLRASIGAAAKGCVWSAGGDLGTGLLCAARLRASTAPARGGPFLAF